MKTLPNGLKVFNGTPHVIRFWREDWDEPVEVEPDAIVSASVHEEHGGVSLTKLPEIKFVKTRFAGTDEGLAIIRQVGRDGAIVVGSIIAAQAYPGLVVAMTPAPGYERVPPSQKRMNPDKFTVFE